MITTRPAVLATLLAACQGDPKAGPAAGDGTSVSAGGTAITIPREDVLDDFTDGDNSIRWEGGR